MRLPIPDARSSSPEFDCGTTRFHVILSQHRKWGVPLECYKCLLIVNQRDFRTMHCCCVPGKTDETIEKSLAFWSCRIMVVYSLALEGQW